MNEPRHAAEGDTNTTDPNARRPDLHANTTNPNANIANPVANAPDATLFGVDAMACYPG